MADTGRCSAMQPPSSSHGFDLAVLAIGVAAVSTAAVLIRKADAPALVIASSRLSLASLPLISLAAVRRERVVPGRARETVLTILAGALLAAHFGFWIASVQQTSIITSVVLVTAQPLFVALASGPVLGERPGFYAWLGIAVAGVGALVMVTEDFGSGSDALQGDLFAILGAMFAAAYILTGRAARTGGTLWRPYVTSVYSIAALILLALTFAAGNSLRGYSAQTYGFFLLLALIPQLIGHTAINRSLGYMPASSVAIAILGEPVGATVLGVLLLGEEPTLPQFAGSLLVLAGVYLGLRSPASTPESEILPAE
jgi:drug/metabolite transporter (DMT)-like permease